MPSRPRMPVATVRVPLTPAEGFAAAAARVPALAHLGTSHLSLPSPLRARAGSADRDDVVDHGEVDPALGGEEGLRALADAAHAAGMGLVADLTATHLTVHEEAPLWERLLAEGRSSEVAGAFDVDWEPPLPGAADKVIVPTLQESYGDALTGGLLGLAPAEDGDGVRVTYRERTFPVNAEVTAALERSGLDGVLGVPGEERSWQRMHSLLERQHYRLVSTAAGARLVNWRRVPPAGDRAALAVEDERVFELAHGRMLTLVADGVLDGLRVVGLAGVADPARHLQRLRERVGADTWLVVDDPVQAGDGLPEDWPVDGTAGHELLRVTVGAQVDREGLGVLATLAELHGGRPTPGDRRRAAREALDLALAPDLRRCTAVIWAACQEEPAVRDVDYRTLLEAVSRLAVAVGRGRGHVDPTDGTATPLEVRAVDAMVALARDDDADPPIPERLWVHLRQLLAGEVRWSAANGEAVTRFQQLTGALAGTARRRMQAASQVMLGGHEVVLDPAGVHRTLPEAHQELAALPPRGGRLTGWRGAAHGEDVRLRMAALTGMAGEWTRLVADVLAAAPPPDPAAALGILQVVVGTWPVTDDGGGDVADVLPAGWSDALAAHVVMRARDRGIGTAHHAPDGATEQALVAWTRRLVDPTAATARMIRPLARRAAEIGMAASLSQVLLRSALDGVPDVPVGGWGWDEGVGPASTATVPTSVPGGPDAVARLWAARRDGRLKGHVIAAALRQRRADPDRWREGPVHALAAAGRWAEHMLVLARGEVAAPWAVVVAPRVFGRISDGGRFSPVGRIWADTDLTLPGAAEWTDVLTGSTVSGGHVAAAEVLATLPVALLVPA